VQNYVDMVDKPMALEKPDWIVDPGPDFQNVDRFTVFSSKQSLTAGSDLLTHNQGDYSGVASKQWANVSVGTSALSAVQSLDISSLTAETAAKRFNHVVTASKRSG
jgi:hypothetical protein